jgi:hypothetical protein
MARFNNFSDDQVVTSAVEQAPARVSILDNNSEILHNQTIVVITSLTLNFDKKLIAAMLKTAMTQVNMGIAISQAKASACIKLGLNSSMLYSKAEVKSLIELLSSSIYYEMGENGTEDFVYDLKMCVLDLREALLPLAVSENAHTNKIRKQTRRESPEENIFGQD